MEDGERVHIYNGAMWMEVLCARRDCAMPAWPESGVKAIWLYADTSACLCGHLHDPRLKGSAQIWKREQDGDLRPVSIG
jgi:hypothetical protein